VTLCISFHNFFAISVNLIQISLSYLVATKRLNYTSNRSYLTLVIKTIKLKHDFGKINKKRVCNKKSPTILENAFNVEAIHCTSLVKGAAMQFGSQSVYAGIIDDTRTFLTDCVLSADHDDRNLTHVTKPAEAGVVGIDIGEA